ncbi:hypothetical protein [Streptomyces parvus]|uniref:Uncharacterized protein n=1 Tax=Streptomyces parvus TaxID=66428 RepID=A0A7K3RRM2_9ACTN|nr:hypothetical protein [Streptomyces parvus]NEC17894.1 hypothetical protein [Streptomyces parvus]
MITSTVIYERTQQYTETGVRLRIDDVSATLNVSGNPNNPKPISVTELAIGYKATQVHSGRTTKTTVEVTNITYLLDDPDCKMAYVHASRLDQPQEWPTWVAELVEHYSPSGTGGAQ